MNSKKIEFEEKLTDYFQQISQLIEDNFEEDEEDEEHKLLNKIHKILGDDKIDYLIQLLQRSNDSDFRSPK